MRNEQEKLKLDLEQYHRDTLDMYKTFTLNPMTEPKNIIEDIKAIGLNNLDNSRSSTKGFFALDS